MANRDNSIWPQWEENRLFTVLLAILLVYGIVFIFVKIQETLADVRHAGYADQMPPTISVNAEGRASAVPDIAKVDLTVIEQAETSSAAQDANTQKSNAVLAKMREVGIADVDLQTSAYNVYPVYNYDVSPAVIEAYTATQTITVTIRDTAQTDAVLAAAGDLEVSQIGDVQLNIEDDSAVAAEARKEAIAKAYAQAVDIANAMHADLGKVVTYYESSGGYYPYYERALSSSYDGGVEIAEGQDEVVVSVSITYAID